MNLVKTEPMTEQIQKRVFADCSVIDADGIVVAVDVTEVEANSTFISETCFRFPFVFFLSWAIY